MEEAFRLHERRRNGDELQHQVVNRLSAAGQVTFHVSNQADAVPHQLTVIKTDKAPGQLPTSNGKVDLSNLNVIGQTDNIQTGQSQDLSVNLEAGSYVLICNIPSHYSNGMYAGFTVGGGWIVRRRESKRRLVE